MKKRVLVVGAIIVSLAIIGTVAIILWPKKFTLSSEYTGNDGFVEINIEELGALIDEKKSFAVFLYQPDCRASEDFEQILINFMQTENVQIFKTDYVEAKHSGLVTGLKYYPSLAIYNNGKLVDFLKTDEDEDVPAYESEEGLREWWRRYVK